MVKRNIRRKRQGKQAKKKKRESTERRTIRITAKTVSGECTERLTAFGGLLALAQRGSCIVNIDAQLSGEGAFDWEMAVL